MFSYRFKLQYSLDETELFCTKRLDILTASLTFYAGKMLPVLLILLTWVRITFSSFHVMAVLDPGLIQLIQHVVNFSQYMKPLGIDRCL